MVEAHQPTFLSSVGLPHFQMYTSLKPNQSQIMTPTVTDASQNDDDLTFCKLDLNYQTGFRNPTIPQQQRTHRRRRLLRVWVQMLVPCLFPDQRLRVKATTMASKSTILWVGVSENVVYPIVPNGFADHYPVMKNG